MFRGCIRPLEVITLGDTAEKAKNGAKDIKSQRAKEREIIVIRKLHTSLVLYLPVISSVPGKHFDSCVNRGK